MEGVTELLLREKILQGIVSDLKRAEEWDKTSVRTGMPNCVLCHTAVFVPMSVSYSMPRQGAVLCHRTARVGAEFLTFM